MLPYIFALFGVLITPAVNFIYSGNGNEQITTMSDDDDDDTGGETGTIPPKPPKP